ncbi:hypothetical protein Tco_1542039 [Tanacetum coccineum]
MTRSSTMEQITPFENPERVFCLKRRLFETPGLVESSSLEIDLLSNIEENSEEEETTKITTETMEQYMSKTPGNYGSGIARPKINDKTHFELKGQFLKELRENTFSGSEHEDANEHIKKSLRSFTYFISPRFDYKLGNPENEVSKQHYLTDMQEVILFYIGLDVPTRQILDSKGVIPTKTAADAKFGAPYQPGGQYRAAGPGFYQRNNGNSSYPDRRQTLEESLTKFMTESAKRHEENSNIIKEIRASTDAAIRNQGASIKTLEI